MNVTYKPGGGGGHDPPKVRVGSPGTKQMKLYLYNFIKKGGLFYMRGGFQESHL